MYAAHWKARSGKAPYNVMASMGHETIAQDTPQSKQSSLIQNKWKEVAEEIGHPQPDNNVHTPLRDLQAKAKKGGNSRAVADKKPWTHREAAHLLERLTEQANKGDLEDKGPVPHSPRTMHAEQGGSS